MNILLNLSKYDYGIPERGNSFEFDTFYPVFSKRASTVDLFDYMTAFQSGGQEQVERGIIEQLGKKKYDLIFTFPIRDEINKTTLDLLKKEHSGVVSLAWMADDKWRWESYSQYLAPHFDFVITTDSDAVQKYQRIGYDNIILSQWAHDPKKFQRQKMTKIYDVTFIGGVSAWRRFVMKKLLVAGIKVACFGTGWQNGRVTEAEMINIYNQSKIVLNLSNSAQPNLAFLLDWNLSKISQEKNLRQKIVETFPGLVEYLTTLKRKEDIKARFFEVTGCGAFLLTYPVEQMSGFLRPGQDLVCYQNLPNLIEQVRYYLHNPIEREKIAANGYKTTKKLHTYDQRFAEIWSRIGINE